MARVRTKTWLVRSRNLILAYSQARRGTVFTRTDQPDEYTILLPSPMTRATIRTADAAMDVSGEAIVVVSADSSELSIQSDEYPAAGPSDGMPGGRAQR